MLLLEELFRDHPGSLARERCRDEVFARDEDESVRDLVYGEFGFMSLVAFFETHRARIPREGAKLVDLGAGVGRPAFAAATLHPFESCVGIECLRGLHALGAELTSLGSSPFSTRDGRGAAFGGPKRFQCASAAAAKFRYSASPCVEHTLSGWYCTP